MKNFLLMYIKNLYSFKWNVGFLEQSSIFDIDTSKVIWLKHGFKRKWFADPFLLDVTDEKIVLLVEEFDFSINKGRIARLSVDRKTYFLIDYKIVLEEDAHLSFPAIYRLDDSVYVYPENSAAGILNIYKYDSEHDSLVEPKKLLNKPITDGVLLELNNRLFLFSTRLPEQNGSILEIYCASSIDDEFKFFQRIEFDSDIARSAGDFFIEAGQIYRVSQDCSDSYGKAVVFQKLEYVNNFFVLTQVSTIVSSDSSLSLGLHTYNSRCGVSVIDAKGFRYPIFGRLIDMVIKLRLWCRSLSDENPNSFLL